MAEAKKKLKKKTKIRESHRTFVRKIASEAKESFDGGESVDFKKLKSSTLQDKVMELKGMDQEVLEYLDDSKIDKDVSYSCDFASAIQAFIVELEPALVSEKDQGRSRFAICCSWFKQYSNTRSNGDEFECILNSQPRQLAKTRIKEVLRESYRLVSVLGVF